DALPEGQTTVPLPLAGKTRKSPRAHHPILGLSSMRTAV
ncbi:MAG: hypothetical protein AVDCRST_MAG19-2226, partial [uncultured Thermomicrobiales bacterium]